MALQAWIGVGTLVLAVIFASGAVAAWRYARHPASPFRDVAMLVSVGAGAMATLYLVAAAPLFVGTSMAVAAPRLACFCVWTAVVTTGPAAVMGVRRYSGMVRWNLGRALLLAELETVQGADAEQLLRLRLEVDDIRHALWEVERRMS